MIAYFTRLCIGSLASSRVVSLCDWPNKSPDLTANGPVSLAPVSAELDLGFMAAGQLCR